ncbi:MAG: leucine-rich repeat domain-containing protein, partial [Xenococcus sp. (in: cyanobacteria)]
MKKQRIIQKIQEAEEKQLKNLDLSWKNIDKLPKSLGNLSNLTELDLSSNQLTNLPESIGSLSNLTRLDLSSNQLTDLPESIGILSNLNELYLVSNELKKLPESIVELSNSTEIYLSRDQLFPITFFSPSQDSAENPLQEPPLEIAKKGIKEIKRYFRQLNESGKDYIYEAKLLIVGEAGAGKTTLANKIKNPQCRLQENQKSTEGIDVIKWNFPLD